MRVAQVREGGVGDAWLARDDLVVSVPGGPRAPRLARREAAAARVAAAGRVLSGLDAAVAAVQAAEGLQVDPDQELRACVAALLGVAQRTPGFDAVVLLGPARRWGARLHWTTAGLVADLVDGGLEPVVVAVAEPAVAVQDAQMSSELTSELTSELARLLWSRERLG